MLNFIQKIQNLIEAIDKARKVTPPKETQTLSVFITPDFDLIKLEIEDTEISTIYWLSLSPIDDSLGKKFTINGCSLPEGVSFTQSNSLSDYALEMIQHVNRLSYFTHGLKILDMYTSVVEPLHKTSRDTFRIFRYSGRVFIHVSFKPDAICHDDITLEFIGPRSKKLYEKYNKNKKNWDPEAGLHFNLKRILEVNSFPELMDETNCGLCMHYRDEGLAPIYSCDNLNCDEQFHRSCISKWWESKKASSFFHGVLRGECPSCKTFFELK